MDTKTELLKLVSEVNRRLMEIDKITDTDEKSKAYQEYIKSLEEKSADFAERIKNGQPDKA